MTLIRTSIPTAPVSVEDARRHLRIDGDNLDAQLSALIPAAVAWLESETRQSLAPATYRLHLDGFPAGRTVKLPQPPLVSVDAVPNG